MIGLLAGVSAGAIDLAATDDGGFSVAPVLSGVLWGGVIGWMVPSRTVVYDSTVSTQRSRARITPLMSALLEPGQEIVAVDEDGRQTRGRVSSISGDAVVVYREVQTPVLRLFRSPQERTFRAGTITRVEIVDSTWTGGLIGAAVAPLLVYGVHRWEDATVSEGNDMKGLATIVFGGIGAVAAVQIGRSIDLSMNEAIYDRPAGSPVLTLSPLVEQNRRGILARLRF